MRQKAAREKRLDYNQKRQLLMQRNDTEDLYTLKVRLESEVQDLEQQLEDMRAPYQLNTEKLEYNFRVLHERNQESQKTIIANKRKLARLHDTLWWVERSLATQREATQRFSLARAPSRHPLVSLLILLVHSKF